MFVSAELWLSVEFMMEEVYNREGWVEGEKVEMVGRMGGSRKGRGK